MGHWLASCWRGGLKADDTQVLDTMANKEIRSGGWLGWRAQDHPCLGCFPEYPGGQEESKHWICSLCLTPLLPSPQNVLNPNDDVKHGAPHSLAGIGSPMVMWSSDSQRDTGKSLLGLLGKLLLPPKKVMLDGHDVWMWCCKSCSLRWSGPRWEELVTLKIQCSHEHHSQSVPFLRCFIMWHNESS